ncbi:uncharacterized protein PpBr36_06540 [Pyricularia pennisetigena]|uniref:uncharacterized protein n=1 Tax=Pyricularia pennisetigena TaxID=1578925 RepID=UPI0011511FDC|nr:uncharacterized protein PpBr36_06540 [Pyricularia pennisetigena]TLS23458.1 hypothetical protein PpBr36_06540 [Pyricularia pennisetigena]
MQDPLFLITRNKTRKVSERHAKMTPTYVVNIQSTWTHSPQVGIISLENPDIRNPHSLWYFWLDDPDYCPLGWQTTRDVFGVNERKEAKTTRASKGKQNVGSSKISGDH